MTVRDEADILPINIAYHSSFGITDFWIIDNGSTDGTTDVLRELASVDGRIRWRSEPGAFHQSEFATDLAQQAWSAGADWIVPIDADEFWWSRNGELVDLLERTGAGVLVCGLENFVQKRGVETDHPRNLLTMTRRADSVGGRREARELVESGSVAFVEAAYPPKLVLRAAQSLVIGKGNHDAIGVSGDAVPCTELVVLHAPIRSRARLDLLAEHGRRAAAINPDPGTSWHLKRWAALDRAGALSADWNANSQLRGKLNVGDSRHPVRRDNRLRNAVRPFVPRSGT